MYPIIVLIVFMYTIFYGIVNIYLKKYYYYTALYMYI